jgi:transglutaminase-like putative cysteine protease
MFRLGKWLGVVGLAACMLAAREAKAGVGFQPVSPDELKLTSEPLAPGAPAIILYRQVDRNDNVHTPHEDNYIRVKILTEEGRKYADVEIPFLKENEDIVSVRARTIRPDGSIADFGGKVFEKYLVKGKYKGRELKYLAKTFTLTDVQVGSIIEYSYTRDFHEYMLYDSRWILNDELFTKRAQFSLKPFDDSYYGNYSLRWSWNSLPAGAAPPKQDPMRVVRMEATNIPAFQTEDFMPPADELKSRVDFIYEEGFAEKDEASYWKHVGKKRNGQLESFIGKRKAMEEAVAQIVSPSDATEVKLRKIYDRVQKIRNTSYEVQKTEEEKKRAKEKSTENANVEDIWKRGYGNGQQLTWLFLALARAAGFEAYGCWVSDRREYFFSRVTMQSGKLNANVVLVKLNGKDIYFDPGAAFTPYGLLTWSETGVTGLRLDKDGGTWITTTLPQPEESRIERVGRLRLSDTGDLEGKLTITYTGLEAMYHRLEERHADDVERKKFLEERATSQISAAAEAELTNKPDWTNSETPLIAEFDVKIPGWASNAGKRAVFPAAIFTAAEKGMFEHANRVQPVYFEYPQEKADDVTIELPLGWQVNSVPSAQSKDAHVIRYSLKVDPSPGTLRLTRKLTIDFMLLEQKYYAALRNFFQIVRSIDAEQVVLQPGEIHASN